MSIVSSTISCDEACIASQYYAEFSAHPETSEAIQGPLSRSQI
jgi:hypothetical protein